MIENNGGIGSAFFGWLADKTSIWFIFNASAYLPLLLPQHHVKHHHQSESEGKSYGANI